MRQASIHSVGCRVVGARAPRGRRRRFDEVRFQHSGVPLIAAVQGIARRRLCGDGWRAQGDTSGAAPPS